MDTDVEVRYLKAQHGSEYLPDGSPEKYTQYTFFLGKHGPFVERFPRDAPQPSSVNMRIVQLQNELRGITG